MLRPNQVRAGAIAGSLGFAFSCAAGQPALAQSETQGAPTMHVSDRSLVVGHVARVRGSVDRSYAGRTAALEFRPTGETGWTVIATPTVGESGSYVIRHSVPRTGTLRVTVQAPAGTVATASASASAELPVSVAPSVGVAHRRLHVRMGRKTTLSGAVRPGTEGVRVKLQVRGRRGWHTVDRGRTGAGGGFTLAG